ncbi:MAG: hypothetical protein QNJ72_41480 [Pleurocapsa sp. MO_226.B13]|nr:hypothetical protein [Pleurocapsa sp. MO_226.B13]
MSTVVTYNPNLPWSREFLFLEADGTVTDLLGTSFRMMIRPNLKAKEILAEASTTNGKIEFQTVETTYNQVEISGVGIKITLDATDTLTMYESSVKAVADLEISYPDGTVHPEVVNLIFNPNLSVTRDF